MDDADAAAVQLGLLAQVASTILQHLPSSTALGQFLAPFLTLARGAAAQGSPSLCAMFFAMCHTTFRPLSVRVPAGSMVEELLQGAAWPVAHPSRVFSSCLLLSLQEEEASQRKAHAQLAWSPWSLSQRRMWNRPWAAWEETCPPTMSARRTWWPLA